MLRYNLVKWTRQIRIFFGGGKEMEEKHHLFALQKPLTPEEIQDALDGAGGGVQSLGIVGGEPGSGERLDEVAAEQYGDPSLWRLIAVANNLPNPLQLTGRQLLQLPPLNRGGGSRG